MTVEVMVHAVCATLAATDMKPLAVALALTLAEAELVDAPLDQIVIAILWADIQMDHMNIWAQSSAV